MCIALQHAAGLGLEIIPLQPFDRLEPADPARRHLPSSEIMTGVSTFVVFSMKGSSSALASTRSIETSNA